MFLTQCSGGGGGGTPATPSSPPTPIVTLTPIQHVIVIIQENRTFDNLFNGFPGADTATFGYDHNGNQVNLQPVNLSGAIDPDHAHSSLVTEYDNGKMDGFDLIPCDMNLLNPTQNPCQMPPDYAYAYDPSIQQLGASGSDSTIYWLLAQYYELSDHMFSTRQVPSFPGHQFLVAGQGPADDPQCLPNVSGCTSSKGLNAGIWGCDAPNGTVAGQFGATYFDPEIFTNPPCYDYSSLGDLMNAKNVSWKYYTGTIGTIDGLIDAYDAIKSIRYGPSWTTNISTPMTNILNDIQNSTLPAVSFVTPPGPASDHAGFISAGGPGWVGEIELYLTQNPALYANTAVFVTWDDSGGWFDHVKPPCYDNRVLPAPATCDSNGPLGFRVPLITMSPYVNQGTVDAQVHDYGSILHFIEHNWNLGSLGVDDAAADDLSGLFNFNQTPIPPISAASKRFRQAMKKYSKAYFENLPSDKPVDNE